jgi:hypothetical protein
MHFEIKKKAISKYLSQEKPKQWCTYVTFCCCSFVVTITVC